MTNWRQQLEVRQLLSMVKDRWQRPEREAAVYLLRIGAVVKIGRSVNPDTRVKSMQLPQSPDEFRVFRTKNNAAAVELEGILHKRFAEKRKYGEWFELTTEQYADAQTFCAEWITNQ